MAKSYQGRNEVYGIRDQGHRKRVGSGITTPGIGISGVFHWIMDQAFWINKILRDKGSKFSSRLEPGIKNLGKITGSAMKKYTSLRPCHIDKVSKKDVSGIGCFGATPFRLLKYRWENYGKILSDKLHNLQKCVARILTSSMMLMLGA